MPRIALVVSGHRAGSTLSALVLGNRERALAVGELTKLPDALASDSSQCSCGARPLARCEVWSDVVRRAREAGHGDAPAGLRVTSGGLLDRARMRVVGNAYGAARSPAAAHAAAALLGAGPRLRRLVRRTLAVYDAMPSGGAVELVVDSDKCAWRAKALWAARPEQVRLIYLVRDARGAAASLLSKGGGHAWSRDARQAARYWQWENRRIRRVLRSLPATAWTLLRYEDLCRQPEETLARVMEFLGLTPDPGMAELGRKTHHLLGGNRMRFRGDSRIRLDERWRTALDARQVAEIENVAGALNAELGYR
jgi:hypothetical protein